MSLQEIIASRCSEPREDAFFYSSWLGRMGNWNQTAWLENPHCSLLASYHWWEASWQKNIEQHNNFTPIVEFLRYPSRWLDHTIILHKVQLWKDIKRWRRGFWEPERCTKVLDWRGGGEKKRRPEVEDQHTVNKNVTGFSRWLKEINSLKVLYML